MENFLETYDTKLAPLILARFHNASEQRPYRFMLPSFRVETDFSQLRIRLNRSWIKSSTKLKLVLSSVAAKLYYRS